MSVSELDDTVSAGEPNPDVRALLDDDRRVVLLDAVHNFRDLGGYRLGDGRTIGWGRLYRSDGLHHSTAADVEVFDAIGLRTVIDLRSSGEAAAHGSFPVERHPVDYHHLPIIDSTWDAADLPDFGDDEAGQIDFLVWAYDDMLGRGAERFADALHVLALADTLPAVFHCMAGKDRTGILAALVLGALEVDHDVIVGDYALTAEAMQRLLAWLDEHRPDAWTERASVPSGLLAARPEAMRIVLDRLVADHGSIASYVHEIGVGPDTVAVIADRVTA